MKYSSTVVWEKQPNEAFVDNKYSRKHRWLFDGIEVTASSSPQVVPLPLSYEYAIDPEESFVASLSSCHMLFFLSLAARNRYIIETYEDRAEGIVAKNEGGKMAVVSVTLHPKISFSGDKIPSNEEVDQLHHQAHEACFIANSVTTNIQIVSS
jgi:organic hydroperoxide reductase OsmC/OhrA